MPKSIKYSIVDYKTHQAGIEQTPYFCETAEQCAIICETTVNNLYVKFRSLEEGVHSIIIDEKFLVTRVYPTHPLHNTQDEDSNGVFTWKLSSLPTLIKVRNKKDYTNTDTTNIVCNWTEFTHPCCVCSDIPLFVNIE